MEFDIEHREKKLYLGRPISPKWYLDFIGRITSCLPESSMFIPDLSPGLRYVSQERTMSLCASHGTDVDQSINILRKKADKLGEGSGPRTLLQKYTTTIHGFKYIKNNIGFLLIADVDDRLRKDHKWQLGEEVGAVKIRFLRSNDEPAIAPQANFTLRLGHIICEDESIGALDLKGFTVGRLLDDQDPRIVFQRFNPIEISEDYSSQGV